MLSKRNLKRPTPAAGGAEFITDREAAFELGVGMSKLFELQKNDPDFPPPVWYGPRSKRHVRSSLRAYAMAKRQKASPEGQAAAATPSKHAAEARHA
ncbi:helix-turn-helix transcriptional regulator [Quisquiliibacterium transsilvanicum]|uniref:Putative DNA-binding transcriptional regulator AlpA n=1 Tax=Quisquiliibacterium transsilvanicum TaxID=1549638 RepID=A0A7W8M740_9BURK|nr:hypothetical protein [Quisquiliibacterium transsilvanicum]MBB5270328.1 putative DNA-binding transcriptional regulator AlpA [Quisquiliibacterium transsilvanicum]